MTTPVVPFSDLSKHSKRVADRVAMVQRVQVTRRDGEDLYLTTAGHDAQRAETAEVTAQLLRALIATPDGERAILRSLPVAFPWGRHLSPLEQREFVRDLMNAASDAVELGVHSTLHRVMVEWRATARILADPELTAELTRPLSGDDHGEVTAP
jgi:hypothetical protein